MTHKISESGRTGILLAAGKNTRLYPVTLAAPKSLLSVYDKPLIYYPLATLMSAKTRKIIIITTPEGRPDHERLLGNGGQWGMEISYCEQKEARGIADAFILCAKDIDGKFSVLALGDNIFHSSGMAKLMLAANDNDGAEIFAHQVPDPERFGVVEINEQGMATNIEEKPAKPKSNLAVTGCYFYDKDAANYAANLKPSQRGELEITDLNREYLRQGKLKVNVLGEDSAYFDTGTPDSLLEACNYVQSVQQKEGTVISCPEETAWRNGWIDDAQLNACADKLGKTVYGDYLRTLAG